MKRQVLRLCAVATFGCMLGCPFLPAPGPEAVLEGRWTITPADPGDFEGFMYEARFDSNGDLVEINGTRPDGATASLDTSDSTTTVDGSAVSISIPRLAGTTVFDGILSADQNTMTGSITDEIDLGDLEITLPGGDLTLERVVDGSDPCEGVSCDPGESCVDGMCVADDPCDGVTCDPGESCVDGMCIADDPCDGVTCDPGESCVDGVCVPDADPCDGVTCDTCEECVAGTCVPLEGEAAAGETFYSANGCGGCHGANGNDGFAPDITTADCTLYFDKLSGNVSHSGGTVDGMTEQDAADLEAYLASLGQ